MGTWNTDGKFGFRAAMAAKDTSLLQQKGAVSPDLRHTTSLKDTFTGYKVICSNWLDLRDVQQQINYEYLCPVLSDLKVTV
jgi:hypothetical protein